VRVVARGTLLAALVATALLTACGTESDSGSPGGTGGDAGGAADSTASIGQPVRDGKFEFTVTKVECDVNRVGTKDFGVEAQGQYCLVAVQVENIGEEAQSFFGSNQYLYDEEGRQFSADDEAAIYLENSQSLYEEINPGNSVQGTVVFDIPKNATPARIELHDSAFSGGVTVDLT
jgi:hypothetical protein